MEQEGTRGNRKEFDDRTCGGVVQLVRTPACHAGGRGVRVPSLPPFSVDNASLISFQPYPLGGPFHRDQCSGRASSRVQLPNRPQRMTARAYFVDSPNPDEDCLALPRPRNKLKCYQIEAADPDERHPPKRGRYGGN